MQDFKRIIRQYHGKRVGFLERESGGYRSSVASEGGPAIREIQAYVAPAAVTLLACVEQTFTISGLLLNERIAYVTQLSPASIFL